MTHHDITELDRLAERRELIRVRLDGVLLETRRLADELCRIDIEIHRANNENNEPQEVG